MKVFPNLPFPLQIKNDFGNIRILVQPSPCEQGIILFSVEQLSYEGEVVESRYLKLLPENTKNHIFFGKEREIIDIPQGNISNMEVVTGTNDEQKFCLHVRLTFDDESEFGVTWVPK